MDIIYNKDCLEVLKRLEDNSIDAIVTDPPYGLGFMGKEWDSFDKSQFGKKGEEGRNDLKVKKNFNILPRYKSVGLYDFTLRWATECLRVIKPGGNLLSFGGTRTYHRMVCAIEDAGFEIRDCIMYCYGSGFPKSYNLGQAIEKMVITGKSRRPDRNLGGLSRNRFSGDIEGVLIADTGGQIELTTPEAKLWEGYGTGLKPAYEPIVLAMKPLDGTFAENCLKWGVGGLNIDGCRIPTDNNLGRKNNVNPYGSERTWNVSKTPAQDNRKNPPQGRFPANFIHDGSQEVMELFPKTKTGNIKPYISKDEGMFGMMKGKEHYNYHQGDSGSAARFFYCAKASRSERDAGLEDMPDVSGGHYAQDEWSRQNMGNTPDVERKPSKNTHPTVKPLALMEYLVKLVTRPGHIVLDPFIGSGTSAMACVRLGRHYIGCELDKGYYDIAVKRIEAETAPMRLD